MSEDFDLDLPGPLVAAGFADQARRAHDRKSRVFRQYKDVLSKNPAKPADPVRSAGRNRRGVLSFGYLFFAQAKKSNSLAAASETEGREESLDDGRCRIDQQQIPRRWLGMKVDCRIGATQGTTSEKFRERSCLESTLRSKARKHTTHT
jgi:hypothetical protein